ncbi:hypothetical protein N7462_007826 [Penicillium macrosclerotiorum]|uniref:uncharacterized protein n=1 Tax=Penicillium macrosclerotiorum TaxID=303699 RepID=UPI0025471916|nr:uncharacterized protein N7462_007826 [Penicillium macrosclerotiorum]KAJ5679582.1 hypothetical protein N7462_007826 [Penicillium macrosclerotiorum]
MTLLDESGDRVPSASFVMFDIFMIGPTSATAVPHIMFSCTRPESRKIALAAIKQSGILDQLPRGICLGDWDYPPHIKDQVYHVFATPCWINIQQWNWNCIVIFFYQAHAFICLANL